jgi:hypothetical protein
MTDRKILCPLILGEIEQELCSHINRWALGISKPDSLDKKVAAFLNDNTFNGIESYCQNCVNSLAHPNKSESTATNF